MQNQPQRFLRFHIRNEKVKLVIVPLRSSHQRCFVRTGALRNFAKFTEKHLCQSLLYNKVAVLSLKRRDSGTDVFQ